MKITRHTMKKALILSACTVAALFLSSCKSKVPAPTEDSRSPQEILFDDGNYAMFIHFGLYSKLEGV